MTIVTKFGGTSMADAKSIRLVADILLQDSRRKVAVVSAPGVSEGYPIKVTDLLLINDLEAVGNRFEEIMADLGVSTNELSGMLSWISLSSVKSRVAFGEYMSAYILAKFLDWKFVDARRVFTLNQYGAVMAVSCVWKPHERVVIPGFYGAAYAGGIELFPRGGSDISGALVAAQIGADLYENWTDVSGVYTADPRKFREARHLPYLTYREAKMLSLTGATVFHPEAIAPVSQAGVRVQIRNTFAPNSQSTFIGATRT